jgi:hypothetical protein
MLIMIFKYVMEEATYSSGASYAPIFYDLNNSSYYGDFASTSYMAYIGRRAHNTGHLVGSYNSVGANSPYTNPIYTIGSSYNPAVSTLSNMYGVGYSHPNASFINFTGASGWGMYVAADGDARVWLDGSSGQVSAKGYMYAPRYYDYDNTTYYLDPNGTSNLYGLTVNQTITGNISGQARALRIEGFGSSEFTFYQSSGTFEGFSGWHNYLISNHGNGSNYYNTTIAMPFWGPPRYSRRENNTYRGPYEFWTSERTIVSSYDITAPTYYDSDTGYYGNFNSTSRFNTTITTTTYFGTDTNKGYAQNDSTYSSYLRRISFISMNNGSSSWNDYSYHGIGSTDLNGNRADSISINSYNDIILRLDSNSNNSNSYLRVMDNTRGNNQIAYIGSESGNAIAYFYNRVYGAIYYDRNDSNFYADPASTSVFSGLTLGGYNQNNPQQNQWYQQSPYQYTGGVLYYRYRRIGRLTSGSSIGLIEYYAKRDSNYPGGVRGYIHLATYASSSMSVQHDQIGGDGQMTPEVYIDNNRYIWLRISGAAWNSHMRWRWLYRSGQDAENGSTTQNSQPSNSALVQYGESKRFAWGNVGSITHNYDNFNRVKNLLATNELRADIFRDVNDSTYYIEPAGSSVVNNLQVNGELDLRNGIDDEANSPVEVRGNLEFQDNNTLRFGNGSDFQMWFDGADMYFRNYAHPNGDIYFQGEDTEGTNHALLYMRNDTSRPYLQLFENGGERFRTTSYGTYTYGDSRGSGGLEFSGKYHILGTSSNWDAVGQSNLTNLHFQGHQRFWVGAGNGTWFTGTANSGMSSGESSRHDLLLTTMNSDSNTSRAITFAVANNDSENSGWRLGRWFSGTNSSETKLVVDGQIFAKGHHSAEYDHYANHYDSYRNTAAWGGDSGWHKAAIVSSRALQIQSGNAGTNSNKPQLQFHQYGYGGPVIEYDGPNKTLNIGETSSTNRLNYIQFKLQGFQTGLRMNHDQIWRPGSPLHIQHSSGYNTYINCASGGNVGIGADSASYKLHVHGDIYANGGWVRVSGSRGLYFESYGGGWRMQDTTYIRAYNNKRVYNENTSNEAFYTPGGVTAKAFYDYNDTAYYADPASTSRFNDLTLTSRNQQVVHGGNIPDYVANIENGSFYNITDRMTTDEVRAQLNRYDSKITKVDDNTAPAEGCFRVAGYVGYDDGRYIKIDKDSSYIFECWIKVIDGGDTNQRLYLGWTMYDRNKSSYGNSQRYWGSAGTQFDTNSNTNGWYKVTGRIKGIGSGTGNFKSDAQYARPVLLINYSSNVGVVHICGLKLYKAEQAIDRLRFHNGSRFVHNLTDQRYPYIQGSSANSLRVQTDSGYIDLGPQNTSYAHIQTDRSRFYFNTRIEVDSGEIRSHNEDLNLNRAGSGSARLRLTSGRTYSDQAMTVSGDLRAPIFYDSNDPSYYIDPNNYSTINRSAGYPTIDIRRSGSGGTAQNGTTLRVTSSYANHSWGIVGEFRIDGNSGTDRPAILYSSGQTSTSWTTGFSYANNDDFGVVQNRGYRNGGWGTIRMRIDNGGNVFNNVSTYSPIFRDNDNSGYYGDFASTSNMNTVQINGTVRFMNYGLGMTGTYSSTRLQTIFNMDDQYSPNAAGTSTQNAYGLYWSHPNAGSLGGANNLNDHGLLIINNGSFRAAISSRAVFSNEVRGTLFRDYNSTGYYVDPASQSVMNTLTLSGNRLGFVNSSFDAEIRVSDSNPDGTGATFEFWGDGGQYNAEVSAEVFRATRHMRAGVYYDVNDAAYYANPNSTSNFSRLDLQAYSFFNNGLQVKRNIGTTSPSWQDANHTLSLENSDAGWISINFHRAGYTSNNIYYTGTEIITDDTFRSTVDMRAPIFYDSNDTAAYFDKNRLIMRGGDPTITFRDTNHRSAHIHVNSNLFYILRGSGNDSTSWTTTNGNWPMVINLNNNDTTFGADVTAINYMYAQRFYDRDNTGYYGDFASTSYMNDVRVNILYDRQDAAYYWHGASTSRSNYHRINNAYSSEERRYTNPNGGSYSTTSSSVTGAIRIYLPANRRRSNTMHRFRVVLYEYSTGRSTSWEIGGYNYGTGQWYNVFATQLTDSGKTAYTVRWGDDGSRQWVTIGENSSTWSYPQVNITDLQLGYSGISTNWGQDWIVNFGNVPGGGNTSRTASLVLTTNNGDNFRANASFAEIQATIMRDGNDTNYYVDPNSTSRMATIVANTLSFNDGFDIYDDDANTMSIRSNNSDNGEINFRDSNSTFCARIRWDDDSSPNFRLDTRSDERLLEAVRDSHTYIHYNGSWKIRTESWGLRVNDHLRAEGDVIAYYSDMRLKDKEGDIENALDKVGKLNGFYYRNNKEANMIGYEGNHLQVGLSAQDVESVLPEIVHLAPRAERMGYDYKTINYDRVVPLLVNAINEQKEIVESQKEEIEYLKSELSEMKEMMKELLNKK